MYDNDLRDYLTAMLPDVDIEIDALYVSSTHFVVVANHHSGVTIRVICDRQWSHKAIYEQVKKELTEAKNE